MQEFFQIERKPAFICVNYYPVRSHPYKLVFFAPYPWNEAPSQRFRFEQYQNLLQEQGFKVTFFSFYNQSTWKSLYTRPAILQFLQVLKGLFIAFARIPNALRADYIFIHREVTPIGPPFVEWLLARVFRKRIVYDFDDAIWLTDKTNESWLTSAIRNRGKIATLCRWSHRISCGNTYLMDFAKKHNSRVVYLPTTIDTTNQHNPSLYPPKRESTRLTIGWTGTHSTLKYLYDLEPVLSELEKKYDLKVLVIANQPPQLSLQNIRFLEWNKTSEIEDLLQIDIGIMPLPNDIWTKGKGGFKALQYMALQIPCVISPVGINTSIVQEGENGYLASTPEEWFKKLEALILDKELRTVMGKKGRETVQRYFSIEANAPVFLSLFTK